MTRARGLLFILVAAGSAAHPAAGVSDLREGLEEKPC
jgi:hypothetical protein